MTDYVRPAGAPQKDFAEARAFEEAVAAAVPVPTINRFSSNTDLDIWVPGYFLEIKEKKQRYTERWTSLVHPLPEEHLFIIDELTVRRGMDKYPYVYFLLRDRLLDRTVLAPAWEMIAIPRVRVDRHGKGKWLIDIRNFTEVALHPGQDREFFHSRAIGLLAQTPWLDSNCVGMIPAHNLQK